jgi:type II secretory pathway pseudopilin PulG
MTELKQCLCIIMLRKMRAQKEGGFTLVEITVTLVIMTIVVLAIFGLFVSLVNSTIIAKRRAVALTLSTNQMEYEKSLPYDSLNAGSSNSGVTTTTTRTVNGFTYTLSTNIKYIDDAYDGCASYVGGLAASLRPVYCRGYTSSTALTDSNPNDYKGVNVTATDAKGTRLASVDTQISARVAEAASTTGALFVTVLDATGSPINSANVTASDTSLSPNVNRAGTTDSNGIAIFYSLTPDTNNNYVITASKSGYSTLSTIAVSGSLQPNYPNQKILTQQSSSLTMALYPMANDSLVVETTDTSGSPLANVKVYAKGGYKKYTATTDYSYYYDNYYSNYNSGTVSDSRFQTDGSGLIGVTGLVPANGYVFCNSDNVSSTNTNCAIGSTKYYLAAALPYGGIYSLQPIQVPTYIASSPPTSTYTYGSTSDYMQKVRLMLTTSSTFPRVYTMNPYQLSLASANLSSFLITLTGVNLSSASMKLTQGGNTYTGGSCSSSSNQLKCTFNLTGITSGQAQLQVTNGSGTLTLPTTPLGGFNVNG